MHICHIYFLVIIQFLTPSSQRKIEQFWTVLWIVNVSTDSFVESILATFGFSSSISLYSVLMLLTLAPCTRKISKTQSNTTGPTRVQASNREVIFRLWRSILNQVKKTLRSSIAFYTKLSINHDVINFWFFEIYISVFSDWLKLEMLLEQSNSKINFKYSHTNNVKNSKTTLTSTIKIPVLTTVDIFLKSSHFDVIISQ